MDSIAVNIGVKRESSIELNSRIESQIKSVESQELLDYGIDHYKSLAT